MDNNSDQDLDSFPRADLIDAGILVDITPAAKKAGINFPVAITEFAHRNCVKLAGTDHSKPGIYEEESGRLWNVVMLLKYALAMVPNPSSEIYFKLIRTPKPGSGLASEVVLKAFFYNGDNGERVITISGM